MTRLAARGWPVATVLGRDVGGFNCELAHRNAMLRRTGMSMPGAKKTGTTIVGVVYEVRSCTSLRRRVPRTAVLTRLPVRAVPAHRVELC